MWWQYILFTILAYSLILSIILIYKDHSKFYSIDYLDIIISGPVAWFICLIGIIFKSIFKHTEYRSNFKYKPKDTKYIKRVVKKVIKKYENSNRINSLICLSSSIDIDCSDVYGWKYLIIYKPSNESLNNKFEILMYHQTEDTLNELYKYFDIVDDSILQNHIYNVSTYSGKVFILKNKD